MRAIIIDDKDARALLESLELTKLQEKGGFRDDGGAMPILDQLHRKFHYIVCQWLQDQGADVVR